GDPVLDRAVFLGATSGQPAALRINPAAMTLGPEGTHVFVLGTGALDTLRVDRRTVDPDTGALVGGPSVSTTIFDPMTSLGGAIGIYRVGQKFAAGVQCALPGGDVFPAEEGDLAYHSLGGSHRELALCALGGSYRPSRAIAIGASYQLVQTRLHLRFARDTALEAGRDPDRGITSDCAGAPCGFENPAATETYTIDATTATLPSFESSEFIVGGVLRVADGWWLGVAYQLPLGLFLDPVQLTGTVDVTRAPRDGGDTISGEVTVKFLYPDRLRAGIRGRVTDNLEVVGEARWENLSRMSGYDLRLYGLELTDAGVPEWYVRPRGLHDRFVVQAGVEQVDLGQRVTLGGRLGVQRGVTSDERVSPLTAYPLEVTFDAGAQLRLGHAWVLQAGYGLGLAPSVDTGRGAYDPLDRLACIDSGYDFDTDACAAVRAGYALPTASGVYARTSHAFWMGVRYDL
ncbi:MAG: hypothetical protein KC464_22300, partial [Myxococcales bacterium]|nr:hypothetical protein [Myxococcales bacterium]